MVYAIFSGAYSDWNVYGYFTNPEDAYQYCFIMNNGGDGEEHYWHGDDYYVEEIEEMSAEFAEKPSMHYKFTTAFMPDDSGTWSNVTYYDSIETLAGGMCPNNEITYDEVGCKRNPQYSVTIYSKSYDKEKWLKIAQDMLYQKLAEVNGL